MARKHSLTELTAVNSVRKNHQSDDNVTEVPSSSRPQKLTASETNEIEQAPTSTTRRAIGAVSRSFEQLRMQAVVEIDPYLIDPPLIKDRLEVEGPKLNSLIEQIQEIGQQVPILVRQNPENLTRYQIAYGWRRTVATRKLGIKVKATIKNLTDRELVVAQGQENNERENLSFIEKALYAANLEEGGFDRAIIMSALSIDKTTCSRLISTVKRISKNLIKAIGPAPKIGRDRWIELAACLKEKEAAIIANKLILEESFLAKQSDDRFEYIHNRIIKKSQRDNKPKPEYWSADNDLKIAKISKTDNGTILSFNEKIAPKFGDFVLKSLPDLYADYKNSKEK